MTERQPEQNDDMPMIDGRPQPCYHACMSHPVDSQRGNRRELAAYILIAIMMLFGLQLLLMFGWSIVKTSTEPLGTIVGSVVDFPPSDKPYFVDGDIKSPHYWVVNLEGDIRVFAPYAPMNNDIWMGCNFDWNEASLRFEDPCHGRAFLLDGTAVRWPANRDLDQITYTIEKGQIVVDPYKITLGQCRQSDPDDAVDWRWDATPEPLPPCD